jgi:hypothetical protein
MKRVAIIALCVTMWGCAGHTRPTVPSPVYVPIATPCTPPAALMEPLSVRTPTFVSPSDPNATSALTPDGEKELAALIQTLVDRIEDWKTWASTSGGKQ